MITESNSTRADLAVLNRVGELILLVEIKNRLGTTKAWATAYRRNLIGDGFLPNVPFFLIATPDHFYVWKDAPLTAELREPDYDLNPSAFLTSLPAEIRSLPIFARTHWFEYTVKAWLADLLNATGAGNGSARQQWLIESGLQSALQGGTVAFETLA